VLICGEKILPLLLGLLFNFGTFGNFGNLSRHAVDGLVRVLSRLFAAQGFFCWFWFWFWFFCCCLLPIACCLLFFPVAYCLLPVAWMRYDADA